MRGPYHRELRVRVICFVEEGGSRREAAEQFDVSDAVSSAVRWVEQFHAAGISEPMPRGGGISPLEQHKERILVLASEQPDLTLSEMVAAARLSRQSTFRF